MISIKNVCTKVGSSISVVLSRVVATALITGNIGAASASIVLDRSPDFTGGAILVENLLNVEGQTLSQWNIERFTLDSKVLLEGVDIYSNSYGLNKVGNNVVIRIWSSENDHPDSLLYKSFSHITIQDGDGSLSTPNLTRKYAPLDTRFSAVASLQYWISMTGSVDNLGMATYANVDDGSTWLGRTGDSPSYECNFCGDMAFRLHGSVVSSVPEPSSGLLLVLGCVVLPVTRSFIRGSQRS